MKIKLTHPLISCICITSNRPELLLKSIICFDTQTYPNKELVISYPSTDLQTKSLIANISKLADITIIPIERSAHVSIGTAKNDAVSRCKGEYVCIWDDDDWYHEKRIAFQYNHLKSKARFHEASMLSKIILFDGIKQKVYHSFTYNWGGSLLCKRDILIYHKFQDANVAEDTALIKYLENKNYLNHHDEAAFLYIFQYHGHNSLDYFHYAYYTRRSELLDKVSLQQVRDLLYKQVDVLPG